MANTFLKRCPSRQESTEMLLRVGAILCPIQLANSRKLESIKSWCRCGGEMDTLMHSCGDYVVGIWESYRPT